VGILALLLLINIYQALLALGLRDN